MTAHHRTVLRLPRVDHGQDEPEFILVHVTSAGHNDLDLKLIGTEGNEVFSVTLQSSQTSKLKAKNNSSTAEEWEGILRGILLGTIEDETQSLIPKGVEAVAKMEDQSMTITIQKRIEGITQRLGTLTLPSNDEEVDIFDWCGRTIQARDSARAELEQLRTIIDDQKAEIMKLKAISEEFVKLKSENETQLLEKFSVLLNEKKLKIRDQQRLLSGATIDPAKAKAVEQTRLAVRSRSAGPSRKGKRKANSKDEGSDDESDDGYEKMEVDDLLVLEPGNSDPDQERRQTSDEDTADETQSDSEDSASQVPESMPETTKKLEGESAKSSDTLEDEVPPKRALPFTKKTPAQPLKPEIDEGSETEDDEL